VPAVVSIDHHSDKIATNYHSPTTTNSLLTYMVKAHTTLLDLTLFVLTTTTLNLGTSLEVDMFHLLVVLTIQNCSYYEYMDASWKETTPTQCIMEKEMGHKRRSTVACFGEEIKPKASSQAT